MQTNRKYQNPYGVWRVTTEGDVEGKTTINLGTFEGFIDEIALALADKVYYTLCFHASEKLDNKPKAASVSVQLDIDSGTWSNDMSSEDRVREMKMIFKDRPVNILEDNFFSSFKIISKTITNEDFERQAILEKLTDREKQILGLK